MARKQTTTIRKTIRRSRNLRGVKGGVSTLQRVSEGVEKTSKKIGLKGGAAILAGSAAGMAIGTALGSIAGAVLARGAKKNILNKKMADIADSAKETAEEITKRADNLKEAVKKISD